MGLKHMLTNLLAMEKVSNILGITMTVALGIVLVTSVTVTSIFAATNATAANSTKAAATNANSASLAIYYRE